jgi:hypothetical protein
MSGFLGESAKVNQAQGRSDTRGETMMSKPTIKPVPGMFPAGNGQWCKKFRPGPSTSARGGRPQGQRGGQRPRRAAQAGILAGTDHLRALAEAGGKTVNDLMRLYVAQRKLDVTGRQPVADHLRRLQRRASGLRGVGQGRDTR